jgi:hypothetical protein
VWGAKYSAEPGTWCFISISIDLRHRLNAFRKSASSLERVHLHYAVVMQASENAKVTALAD